MAEYNTHIRGLECNQTNSLNYVLNNDVGNGEESIEIIKHSPYFDNEEFIQFSVDKKNQFTLLSLNIQSINAKFDQLQIFLKKMNEKSFQFDVLCLQETWLNETSCFSLLDIEDYNFIPQSSLCSAHGGLAFYLHKKYMFKKLPIYVQSEVWEGLFIEISGHTLNKNIIIGNIYRPPRDRNENYQTFINELTPILSGLESRNCEVFLTGDFNIDLLKIKKKPIFSEFFDVMISHSFYPKITLPTRLSNNRGTLIDNIYCKLSSKSINSSSGILISGLSDHLPYFLSINLCKNREIHDKFIYTNRHSSDSLNKLKGAVAAAEILEKMNSDINENPNYNYDIIHNTLVTLKQKYLPSKKVKFNKRKHKFSEWITTGIVNSINFRDKLYKKLKNTDINSVEFEARKINLRTYNVILNRNIYLAKKNHYHNLFDKYKRDIKKTWSTISTLLHKKGKKITPEYIIKNGLVIKEPESIVNNFNEYFANIGPNLAAKIKNCHGNSHKNYLRNPSLLKFSFTTVDQSCISKIIDDFAPKNSSGHDEISNSLIKLIKDHLIRPLTITVNQSLTTGIFPQKLKIAKVSPLFKNSDATIIENYRPISLLTVISKIFEKVIFQQINKYFTENKLFNISQYGFRKNHSTELAALELIDRLTTYMNNGDIPITIFLDLSKAFDTLNHSILLDKLKHYGIKDCALNLLNSYLSDRQQFVQINNIKSSLLPVKTGVPQGSILGPLLFIIYLNDFTNASDIFKIISYADDSTLLA